MDSVWEWSAESLSEWFTEQPPKCDYSPMYGLGWVRQGDSPVRSDVAQPRACIAYYTGFRVARDL